MATEFKSLRGQLLLDGGSLGGSFFHRTVVLICHHDAEGAFGLVLNRPAGGTLGELVVADLPDSLREEPVFLGGPVQPSAFSYLLSEENMLEANVLPNLTLGHSLETLVDWAEERTDTRSVRVFAGYSGWSPGQLESEMRRRAWLTHPATVELVFHTPVERLWKVVLGLKGWEQRLLADAPEDYSHN